MTIALAAIPESTVWMEAITLAVVGTIITAAVYGAVALIVKMDDVGLHMAKGKLGASRAVGRGLVAGMPKLMAFLSTVGTLAMLWVGGNIVIHGMHALGVHEPYGTIHHLAEVAAHAMPASLQGFVNWLVTAACDGVLGLGLGLLIVPLVTRVLLPMLGKQAAH